MTSRSGRLRDKALDIGASQGGAISRAQLLQLGLSSSGIRCWIETSKLHRVYRGSYSTSREIERETVWWAAVLSAGVSSVISHMSALHLWGIESRSGPTEVTRSSSGGRDRPLRSPVESGDNAASLRGHIRIPALRIHRSLSLRPTDVTAHMGVPVTSVARTLVDVSGLVGKAKLESLLHEAGRRHLLRIDEVRAAIGSGRGRTGAGLLREIVDGWDPRSAPTRNQLEGRFFSRDSYLQLRGFLVLRLTWNMLKFEPERSIQKVIDHLELCRKQGRRADQGWGTASVGRW